MGSQNSTEADNPPDQNMDSLESPDTPDTPESDFHDAEESNPETTRNAPSSSLPIFGPSNQPRRPLRDFSGSNPNMRLDRDIVVEILENVMYREDPTDGVINLNNENRLFNILLTNQTGRDALLSLFQRYQALVLDENSAYYNVRLRKNNRYSSNSADLILDESFFRSLMKLGNFIRELIITPSGYQSPEIETILNSIENSPLLGITLNDFKRYPNITRGKILEFIVKNAGTLRDLLEVPYHFIAYLSKINLSLELLTVFGVNLELNSKFEQFPLELTAKKVILSSDDPVWLFSSSLTNLKAEELVITTYKELIIPEAEPRTTTPTIPEVSAIPPIPEDLQRSGPQNDDQEKPNMQSDRGSESTADIFLRLKLRSSNDSDENPYFDGLAIQEEKPHSSRTGEIFRAVINQPFKNEHIKVLKCEFCDGPNDTPRLIPFLKTIHEYYPNLVLLEFKNSIDLSFQKTQNGVETYEELIQNFVNALEETKNELPFAISINLFTFHFEDLRHDYSGGFERQDGYEQDDFEHPIMKAMKIIRVTSDKIVTATITKKGFNKASDHRDD